MLLLRLWNYIRGYVIIVVEGYFLEKFINICITKQIFLWDVKRQKNCIMKLKISIKGFKSLPPIAKKTGCRVRIVKKCGLPFRLHRYKNRKAFIFGAFAFILLFYIMSSFIWSIEVKGNVKVGTQTVVDQLASFGIKPGVLKFGINLNDVADKMMLKNDDIAWIGVTVKGTKVKVEIFERVKPPEIISDDKPCNIIAVKDGVIKSISARSGQQVANNGDTVTKGQLLITGKIESKNKDVKPKYVHAMGTVTARTWYEADTPVKVVTSEQERTGKIKSKYTLSIFSKRINLFINNITSKNYEKIETRKKLTIGKDFVFPFELITDKYYENRTVIRELDIEEAKKNAIDDAVLKAKKGIPASAEVVKKTVNFTENDDGELTAHVIIECLEEIGQSKEIGGN